jgi:hypothetical protein
MKHNLLKQKVLFIQKIILDIHAVNIVFTVSLCF